MRLLIIGRTGMLGSDLALEAVQRGWEVIAPTSAELNITEPESVAQIPFGTFGRLDACVNCAAYTAVDRAESESQRAMEVNGIAPGYLANACAELGCLFLQLSTDYVFDGFGTTPYMEEDPTNPQSVYGRSKLQGELAVLHATVPATVFRASWLYGPGGACFPKTIIRAFEAGRPLKVVADQIGCPTYTKDLARAICEALDRRIYPGIYHACGPDAMSWHAFAEQVLIQWTGNPVSIEAITTDDWPTPAKRPPYSVLDCTKLRQSGVTLGTLGLSDFLLRLKD